MMTHQEHEERETEPSGVMVFTAAVSLFVIVSILLLLGGVMLGASPLLFIFYVGILVLTLGGGYYYGRDRWY